MSATKWTNTDVCITNTGDFFTIYTLCLHSTWRNAQFGEKVIIQMEEKSMETAAELKAAIGQLLCVITCVLHTLKNTVVMGPDKPAIPGQQLFRAC